MELYKIAAIAKDLYKEIQNIETESCRRAWQFSLYYAISRIVNNADIEPSWEDRYSQWNIDHLFRAKESAIKSKHPNLLVMITLISETERGVRVAGRIEEPETDETAFDFILTRESFALLELIGMDGRRVLMTHESELIIDSILELQEAKESDGEEVQLAARTNDKIKALQNLLVPIRDIYAIQNDTGKSYIETVVGASIFYLPHPVNECFSGYCSIDALNRKISDRSIVKEHITPRKYAAREILNEAYNLENFSTDLSERFRKFMYLTAEENRRTVNFMEETHDEALINLDIEKFPLGDSPFENNHTRFMNFIGFCKENHRENDLLSLESAMNLLQQFSDANP